MLERLLIVPDTHAPYHDHQAWRLMLKAARKLRPHVVVHMGDLADFYSLSTHSKDPARAGNLEHELSIVKHLRSQLDDLGAGRKLFIEGNHEDRLRRYLQDRAPELHDLISTDSLLKLTENGWEFTPYKSAAKIGELYLTHDTGHSGKYTTARALETFQHSVAIGHHHAIGYIVAGDATGVHQVAAQFGWLGDIKQADYMHRIKAQRNWALGFGIGYHDTETGLVYLVPVPIVETGGDYTCVVEGKILRQGAP